MQSTSSPPWMLTVGPRDSRGKRPVRVEFERNYHADTIDTESAWHREKFIEACSEKFSKGWHELVKAPRDFDNKLFAAGSDSGEYVPPPIRKFSVATLREAFPTLKPPVIEGLLREGETCNVIAPPKYGKSWFVYNVAISVAMGWSLFGRFATTTGKVLIVDNELHPETLASRIPVVAEAMQVDPFGGCDQWQNDIDIWSLRGDIRSINELLFEFERLEYGEFKLIMLDAKYRFGNGDSENDNASEARFYNTIDRIADLTGAAIMLVHHTAKGNQSGKAVTDVGAGAGAQSRAADCHLVLREHEDDNRVVLDAAVRSFPPVAPLVLHWQWPLWVPDEGADPEKLAGNKTKNQEAESQRDAEGIKLLEKVFLRVGRATRSKLRGETGMSPDRVNKLVAKMRDAGRLACETTKVRGNESDEFWLAETAE